MKKILIPTDFTVESLNVLKYVLEHHSEKKIHIVLVHGTMLPDSISELLFFRKNVFMESLMSDAFCEAKDIIANKFFSKIHRIETELYFGFNRSALQKFIEAHHITEAYIPTNYTFKKVNKKSFDFIPQIKKVLPKVTAVAMESDTTTYVQDSVASLFKY
tara:strand:+ start:12009 stop:12488 length:480 start_codon:yes stop_codon:yes gene_type:complete